MPLCKCVRRHWLAMNVHMHTVRAIKYRSAIMTTASKQCTCVCTSLLYVSNRLDCLSDNLVSIKINVSQMIECKVPVSSVYNGGECVALNDTLIEYQVSLINRIREDVLETE